MDKGGEGTGGDFLFNTDHRCCENKLISRILFQELLDKGRDRALGTAEYFPKHNCHENKLISQTFVPRTIGQGAKQGGGPFNATIAATSTTTIAKCLLSKRTGTMSYDQSDGADT